MHFSFRRKVLLLAVALVTTVLLVTLVPVLNAIERDAVERAERTTRLAGVVFDEFMRAREDQLSTTANVLVSDFGFKQAVALGDEVTIRSALGNHAARAGASVALLLDLDGRIVAASTDDAAAVKGRTLKLPADAASERAASAVVDVHGAFYETVTVPVRAPVEIAWVMLGYPIDEALMLHVRSLTGLDVSVVRFGADGAETIASTLQDGSIPLLKALDSEDLYSLELTEGDAASGDFLTLLRPFLPGAADVHVALQLSMLEAMAPYRSIRGFLLGTAGLSLVLAVTGAFWLARTVTRPVQQLVAAARRMREGVYSEQIPVRASDELGELAGGFNAMQQAIADRERHIFHQAHHDSLTGLPNRDLAVARLREALARGRDVSVVSLTLDRFNSILSTLGHRAGDELIELVAGLLKSRTAAGETLGHLGGHEFVLVLPDRDTDRAIEWAESAIDQLRAGVRVAGANVSLRGVAGIATHPTHGADAAELLRRASIARVDAQQLAERVVVYRLGQEDRFLQQLKIVGDFPKALKGNELELHFQPKIDCTTHAVCGVEALVRWRHPELGLLSPGAFVDAIEQAGGISHLTRWVLREAVRCSSVWRRSGIELQIAANISVDDLVDEYLPYYLLDLVRQNGLRPADVTLEVTESAIMHDVHKSLAVASCIHELGFRIAVDDFGTGQSALAQLKRLPVDELKIDKSFVTNLADKNEAIVRSTIELAHHLSFGVVAEGVESAAVLERLRQLGCEQAQGYHVSPPLAAAELLHWHAAWTGRSEGGRRESARKDGREQAETAVVPFGAAGRKPA